MPVSCEAEAAAVDGVDAADGGAKHACGRDHIGSLAALQSMEKGDREDERASMESICGGIWEHSISPSRHAPYTPCGDKGTGENKVSNDACTSAAPHLRYPVSKVTLCSAYTRALTCENFCRRLLGRGPNREETSGGQS